MKKEEKRALTVELECALREPQRLGLSTQPPPRQSSSALQDNGDGCQEVDKTWIIRPANAHWPQSQQKATDELAGLQLASQRRLESTDSSFGIHGCFIALFFRVLVTL